jgi:hypothetical protein
VNTAITIAAIVIPALVAGAAIVFGWLQHRGRAEQDRGLVDLENVRTVLDEAAIALHQVAYVLDDVRSFLAQHGGVSVRQTDEGNEAFTKLGRLGKDLDVLVERLAIRFDDNTEIVRSFKVADATVLSVYRALALLRPESPSDGSPVSAEQARRLNDEKRAEIDRDIGVFEVARSMAAAHQTAGARIDVSRAG